MRNELSPIRLGWVGLGSFGPSCGDFFILEKQWFWVVAGLSELGKQNGHNGVEREVQQQDQLYISQQFQCVGRRSLQVRSILAEIKVSHSIGACSERRRRRQGCRFCRTVLVRVWELPNTDIRGPVASGPTILNRGPLSGALAPLDGLRRGRARSHSTASRRSRFKATTRGSWSTRPR